MNRPCEKLSLISRAIIIRKLTNIFVWVSGMGRSKRDRRQMWLRQMTENAQELPRERHPRQLSFQQSSYRILPIRLHKLFCRSYNKQYRLIGLYKLHIQMFVRQFLPRQINSDPYRCLDLLLWRITFITKLSW